ncbi:ankyrin repeat domain-containing protein [Cellulomonas endophytica]|uniref:ankyrin repeat domain-containing protein n=1 Tax=Cellulomonas endophytica TaxID=2494735 RepID=UPI0010116755|nr:ankyrin repeat domain-containing protein [Cellulomonas endophytica]
MVREWRAETSRDRCSGWLLAEHDALADAARDARWAEVTRVLDDAKGVDVNGYRIGGTSWFAPLHQAAWHGAPVEVVDDLRRRGAWLSLPAADGRTPADVARERGHHRLAEVLCPPALDPFVSEDVRGIEARLRELVDGRRRDGGLDPGVTMRLPPVAVLAESGSDGVWMPVSGMYGGFLLRARENHLYVESWSRMAAGSWQAHVVTRGAVVVVSG